VVAVHDGEGRFRTEAELTLFLRMRTKEIVKIWRKCIPTEELFTCYRKWGSSKRTARSDFWPEAC